MALATFDHKRPEIGRDRSRIAQSALDACLKYSTARTAFGQPISNFQAIQFMSDMRSRSTRCLLTYKRPGCVDQGSKSQAI